MKWIGVQSQPGGAFNADQAAGAIRQGTEAGANKMSGFADKMIDTADKNRSGASGEGGGDKSKGDESSSVEAGGGGDQGGGEKGGGKE